MTLRVLDSGLWRAALSGDVSLDDRGVLLGDGVFETFKVIDGRIRFGALHKARLDAACTALDLDMPDWAALDAEINSCAGREPRVGRLTITRGPGPRGLGPIPDPSPRVWLSLARAGEPPRSLSLHLSGIRRSPTSLAACHKTLSYADNAAARREAVALGADMALLLTSEGHISGGDCANIFAIAGLDLLTPSADCAIRCGVTRERVLGLATAQGLTLREARFELPDFEQADALFVTNSAMGVVPITRLGDVQFPEDHSARQSLQDAEARQA